MRPRFFFLLVAAGAVVAACSGGEQMSATFSSDMGGAGGRGGAGASGPVGSASSSAQASSAASSAQASSAASSAASSSQASSAASSSQASSSGSMGAGCGDVNDCTSAVQLTSIHGDEGDDIRTVNGSTSQWLEVLVQDVMPTIGNNNESYTATLTSPPGVEFALFAYDGTLTAPDCLAAPLVGSGSPQVIMDAWPDGSGDDSRWISFEVRYVSGQACDATTTWTLKVEGYTGG